MNNDLNTIYEWKESYNTGNEEIDFQHQYFLKLIHRIAELFPVFRNKAPKLKLKVY
jgi:hemerythrin